MTDKDDKIMEDEVDLEYLSNIQIIRNKNGKTRKRQKGFFLNFFKRDLKNKRSRRHLYY